MTTPNVPNVKCGIAKTSRGKWFTSGVSCATDTPATAIPNERVEKIRKLMLGTASLLNLARHRGIGGHGPSNEDLLARIIALEHLAAELGE